MGVTTAMTHGVRTRDWRGFDTQLFIYLILLIAFGIVMGHSASFNDAPVDGVSQTVKTLIWTAIGLTLFFVAAGIDYHWLQTLAMPIYLVIVGLLAITLLVGTTLFGAQLSVNVAGLDFQFSEVSKVLTIAVLASFLVRRGRRIGRLSTILLASGIVALPTLLVTRQPDLGTALVFIAIAVGMLFMAGASLGWMGLLAGLLIAAAPIALGVLADYQRSRLFCFLNPGADPQGACYQLLQALSAVQSGGLTGQGLTAGRQNQLGSLPVQSTDFIFTVVAEELGLIGGLVLLALFGLLIWRIALIGWRASDSLGTLLAAGLATMILFQVLVNVGMVTGIMPVIGLPLPFVSYGGSSLISLLFGLGILQSVRMRSQPPST